MLVSSGMQIPPTQKPVSIFKAALDTKLTLGLSTERLGALVHNTLFGKADDTPETDGSGMTDAFHETGASQRAGASSGAGVLPRTGSRFKVSVNNMALDLDSICRPGTTAEGKGQLVLEEVENLVAREFERQNHIPSLAKAAAKEVAALMLSGELAAVDEDVTFEKRQEEGLSSLTVESRGINIAFFDGFMLLHKTSGWKTSDPSPKQGDECDLVTDFAVRVGLTRSLGVREIFTASASEKYALTVESAFFHISGSASGEMTDMVELSLMQRIHNVVRQICKIAGIVYHEVAPMDMSRNGIRGSRCAGMSDVEGSAHLSLAKKGRVASNARPDKAFRSRAVLEMPYLSDRSRLLSRAGPPEVLAAKNAGVALATKKPGPTFGNPSVNGDVDADEVTALPVALTVVGENERKSALISGDVTGVTTPLFEDDGFGLISGGAPGVTTLPVDADKDGFAPISPVTVEVASPLTSPGRLQPGDLRLAIHQMAGNNVGGKAWLESALVYGAGLSKDMPSFLGATIGTNAGLPDLLISAPVHDLGPAKGNKAAARAVISGNRSIADVVGDVKKHYLKGENELAPVRVLIPVAQSKRTYVILRRAHWVLLDLQFSNGALQTATLYDPKANSTTYNGTGQVQAAMQRAGIRKGFPVQLHCLGDQPLTDNVNCGRHVVSYIERLVKGERLTDRHDAELIE